MNQWMRYAALPIAIAFAANPAAASGEPDAPPLGTRTQCAVYRGLPPQWRSDPHAGMRRIAAGSFQFGSDRGYAEERPTGTQQVETFWIDRTEVTNAQFGSFVAATGYVTDAERSDGAAVFRSPGLGDAMPTAAGWWHLIKGADWKHPQGPDSNIIGREHEPVVDVTYADALAYARWLGHALPSEVEWEFAAKAGRSNEDTDRALRDAQGHPLANFWQGLFPFNDSGEDGFAGRAPVGCFPPNPYGLHDMIGNVWEWTTDRWLDHHLAVASANLNRSSTDEDRRVIKGGSFLCSVNYCMRARASSRQGQEADLPTSHIGFRTLARN
jgi:formylglycine-generating enzyme required for sulfatase activity